MLCVAPQIRFRMPPRKYSTGTFILVLCLVISNPVSAQQASYIQSALHVQTVKADLDFTGSLRETRFNSIDISLREQLIQNVDGALLFGYLDLVQESNPISAGQNTIGEYIGIDLQWHMLNYPRFKMLTAVSYRYAVTDAEIDAQKVEWQWHQVGLGLRSQTYLSPSLSLILGVSTISINGVEKAVGTLDQALDFKAKDSLTGHIALQLTTGRAGQIGIEFQTGSLHGGRIVFQRTF